MSTVEAEQRPQTAILPGNYQPGAGGYDEMLAADGQLRAHWGTLAGALQRLTIEDFEARRESGRRILREHGATHNIHSDAQGLDRPWELDMLPLLIPPEEWRMIEDGLVQRARLLNVLLADIYGAQRVVREGVVPPAFLYTNPGFLRPCHGIRPAGNQFLFFHAVDLARAPDGQWWVLADRAQTPPGAGYALENRIVLARVFPDEFRDCKVQRLAGFFQTARDTLRSLAPRPQESANIVMLTSGPYHETYFEQVFLARYLGFPVVEGGDLTVRERRVFIKTLEGLLPVDVIVRRVEDSICDPLEFEADSSRGVAGLVEAARAGNVTVANALGSGAVEAPMLLAFTPALCQHLLSEDLKLPNVATWWCGQQKELDYVINRMGELVIQPAFASGTSEPAAASGLSPKELAAQVASLRAAPGAFAAQERIAFSSAPVWERGQLKTRPLVLRAFICATTNGFCVMPGGLTRFSVSPERLAVSMRGGGGSKDTWVLADSPVSPVTLLRPPAQVVRLERAAAEVPSRVADNLFWFGRYAERLEDTARILRCILSRLVGEAGAEETPELSALIILLTDLDLFPARFRQRFTLGAVERETYRLIYQSHRLGTIREVTGRLRNMAFVLRDRFSADTWNILSKLQVDAQPRPGRVQAADALAILNALVTDLAAFSGMEMENMTRGHGWRFLGIGRRLERATNMVTLLQSACALPAESNALLEPLLEIADSVMTYRRRYLAQPQWPGVLDLLLADETNPRSLAFQISALADHAANLPRENAGNGAGRPAARIAELRAVLEGADWQAAVQPEAAGRRPALENLLQHFASGLRGGSDIINHLYFSHADSRRS